MRQNHLPLLLPSQSPPLPSPWLTIELDHLCSVENLKSAQGEYSYHIVFIWEGIHEAVAQHTHCCLWKCLHQKINQFIRRCHPYATKSTSKAVLSRMQLTLHATRPTFTALRAWCQPMSAWSVKPRCAPSRHCTDARVYGHTTTAMHDVSTPPTLNYSSCGRLRAKALDVPNKTAFY